MAFKMFIPLDFTFETGSHYGVQAGLQLVLLLLPQSPSARITAVHPSSCPPALQNNVSPEWGTWTGLVLTQGLQRSWGRQAADLGSHPTLTFEDRLLPDAPHHVDGAGHASRE